MNAKVESHWKRFFGVESYKYRHWFRTALYNSLGITLPKMLSQEAYWQRRGEVYRDEILSSGYLGREIFFQDMLVSKLRSLDTSSFFEAGCGFGWNVKRVKEEFPHMRVGGVDFSETQLQNSVGYMGSLSHEFVQGDICAMPLEDNAYDVGFSLGVFMNIHPSKIEKAVSEMLRVSQKYVIHLEYDEAHAGPELRNRRAMKPNIISHCYRSLYEQQGREVLEFATYKDFGSDFDTFVANAQDVDRWEALEGADKYIWIVVKV
jgi:ubiquinone/menaquinone biosynthesis C-methylase UbiE